MALDMGPISIVIALFLSITSAWSSYYYSDQIVLQHFDKLGRYTNYDTVIHLSHWILPNGITIASSRGTNKRVGESSMVKTSYWGRADRYIYLQKEDAYNTVINKLREERRNVDKKMLALQKELYNK